MAIFTSCLCVICLSVCSVVVNFSCSNSPPTRRPRVLEVGSGYQAAILAHMGHKVVSIERLDELANFAKENLFKLTYIDNVKILVHLWSLQESQLNQDLPTIVELQQSQYHSAFGLMA